MEEKLEAVFRAVFELPETADVRRLQQINYPRWDSLAHVTLVSAIENEFAVSVDLADSLDLTSFEAVLVYLEERQ